MKIPADKYREMLITMLRIRSVQERIESLYLKDQMKTPIHLCIGQEAVAAGICSTLEKDDYISSNHRGHGHYLAKGGDLKALIAELHCKKTGCSKGFGGSMHLIDVSVNHLGSSAIVGGGIPIGTGLGLAAKMKQKKSVSAVFFGDGAADEGVLYESLNFAILKKLPVIYVLENNQWSVCSHVSTRQATDNVFHNAPQHLLMTQKIDGNDVLQVYETACHAVERARNGQGPSFIECQTYRILGHAGCKAQDLTGYRNSAELERWGKKCPIKRLQKKMLSENMLTEETIANIKEEIRIEIDDAFIFAEESTLPMKEKLQKYTFCE